MAGGLHLASKGLSWKSHVRLCILIADAPCHGNMYHSGLGDRFPGGDKNGLDPSKLLYNLKVLKFPNILRASYSYYVESQSGG